MQLLYFWIPRSEGKRKKKKKFYDYSQNFKAFSELWLSSAFIHLSSAPACVLTFISLNVTDENDLFGLSGKVQVMKFEDLKELGSESAVKVIFVHWTISIYLRRLVV